MSAGRWCVCVCLCVLFQTHTHEHRAWRGAVCWVILRLASAVGREEGRRFERKQFGRVNHFMCVNVNQLITDFYLHPNRLNAAAAEEGQQTERERDKWEHGATKADWKCVREREGAGRGSYSRLCHDVNVNEAETTTGPPGLFEASAMWTSPGPLGGGGGRRRRAQVVQTSEAWCGHMVWGGHGGSSWAELGSTFKSSICCGLAQSHDIGCCWSVWRLELMWMEEPHRDQCAVACSDLSTWIIFISQLSVAASSIPSDPTHTPLLYFKSSSPLQTSRQTSLFYFIFFTTAQCWLHSCCPWSCFFFLLHLFAWMCEHVPSSSSSSSAVSIPQHASCRRSDVFLIHY